LQDEWDFEWWILDGKTGFAGRRIGGEAAVASGE
jgi:hypothetical protein